MENHSSKPTPRPVLLERARETTTSPGVYLMKDAGGVVLYVGKAKNLKNRLLSYFQGVVHDIPRTEMMVSLVNRFDVVLTETEAEALILEATFIKKYKPKFNVRLKDDKTYPYLKIQVGDPFPRLELTRKVLNDGARYFGPFPSAWPARQVMQLLIETFRLRDCSDNVFRYRSRPCILYQMGKCTGPCVGLIDQAGYGESIQEAIRVLEGKTQTVAENLRNGMTQASEQEEYERAAYFRDQLQNLDMITQTQVAFEAGSFRNRDVIGLARKDMDAHGTVLKIRHGRMVSVQQYHLQNTDPSLEMSEILMNFISQYYLALKEKEDHAELGSEEVGSEKPKEVFPEEVLVPSLIAEGQGTAELLGGGYGKTSRAGLLQSFLDESGLLERTVGIKIKLTESSVDDQLLNVARINAEYALGQSGNKGHGHGTDALEEVQNKLHLGKFPRRIECYDISNIQGVDAVASRVVFIDGAPDKNLYRRYKIRTVEGANDFAMMKEVLGRRFANTEEDLPDLVIVDGGKGQLSQAVAILEELSVQGVGVVGLAKSRVERDFQAKEVKASFERIFIPNRKNPVPLLPHTGAYKLLTHVRDEAHRFAINYHRHLRSKRSLKTEEN